MLYIYKNIIVSTLKIPFFLYIQIFCTVILLSSCQMDGCLSPSNAVGGGNGVRVSVPVYDTKYDNSTNVGMWINTGITVGPESRIPLFIDGIIDLCSMDHSNSCNDVGCQIVTFYKKTSGESISVPSMQLSTKDAIMLYPIFPLDFKVGNANYTCNDIVKKNVKGVSFFDPELCELQHENASGKCLTEAELINLCNNGANNIYSTVLNTTINFPPYLGMRYFAKTYNQITARPNSPDGAENNMLYKNYNGTFETQFISNTALVDMRNYGYEKIDCNNRDPSNPLSITRFNSYDVNRKCAGIKIAKNLPDDETAFFFGGEFTEDGFDAFNKDTLVPKYFISKVLISLLVKNENTEDKEYFYNIDDLDFYTEIQLQNFDGIQEGNNITGEFQINTPVTSDYMGGYKFKVEKVCKRFYGKDLYIYVGTPPDHKPGENTNTDLELDALQGQDIHDVMNTGDVISFKNFVINDQSSPTQIKDVNGTVYLGIKGLNKSETFNAQYIPNGGVESSSNAYGVTFSIPTFNHTLSESIVVPFIDFINKILYGEDYMSGVIPQLFNAIFSRLKIIIQLLIVMYITFFGYAYLFGLVQNSQKELLSRLIKIAIIMGIFIAGSNAWNFLGINIYLFFVKGVDQLFSLLEYSTLEIDSKFGFIDRTLGPLLDGNTWVRLFSLFLAGPIGWLVLATIIWGIGQFMSVCLEVIMHYFMMIVGMGWLLSLTPLFIMFKLFNATKEMFDAWIKLMTSFSLKPLFLIVTIALLNETLFWSMNQLINFSSCGGGCAIFMNIGESNPEDPFGFCLLPSNLPAEYANDIGISNRLLNVKDSPESKFMGLPFGIMPLIMFLIITNMMRLFSTSIADTVIQSITGTMGSMQGAARQGAEAIRSIIGKDAETKRTLRNALAQRMDKDSLSITAKDSNTDASNITRRRLPSGHFQGMKDIGSFAVDKIRNRKTNNNSIEGNSEDTKKENTKNDSNNSASDKSDAEQVKRGINMDDTNNQETKNDDTNNGTSKQNPTYHQDIEEKTNQRYLPEQGETLNTNNATTTEQQHNIEENNNDNSNYEDNRTREIPDATRFTLETQDQGDRGNRDSENIENTGNYNTRKRNNNNMDQNTNNFSPNAKDEEE